MQNRDETIKGRGRFDRVGIKELARERRDAETEDGRDPDPSTDPERDFFGEDYEELADSDNYKTWNMRRNSGLRYWLLWLSRYFVRVSYDLTLMAERVSGNNIKKGKGKGE